jgi:hypothetical protein
MPMVSLDDRAASDSLRFDSERKRKCATRAMSAREWISAWFAPGLRGMQMNASGDADRLLIRSNESALCS